MAASLATSLVGRAECTAEYSVQVSADVKASPAQITLSWPQDSVSTPKNYAVYRRAPGASSWGKATILPGSITSYRDTHVAVGTPYEYEIVKQTKGYTGYGYIYSGIDVPLTENRGKLLLVVDKTYAGQLDSELARLQQDLVGDGWTITRLDVNRSDSPAHVKDLIKAEYNRDQANTKAVFLFGHVPVPYSGDIVPDGHYANHQGAWPCDGYYADMDGTWTDNTVNDTTADDPRNHNIPGDGKFDQSKFPAPLKLMVGRVDLANMPGRMSAGGPATFPSELELLRNYLNKDHNFRNKITSAPERAIVGDYFGVRDGEAFAASGWRNFAPFVGAAKITTVSQEGTWLPTLRTNAYLFAYGCGSGSYTSIGGIGNVGQYRDGVTTELVQDDPKAVFTLLYGSWLGDWDSEDNIQRAVLATKDLGLTCSWSGRPHWFMQHMALGMPIGYSTRLTQNDGFSGLYKNEENNCAGWTHIALMGDPTLRMQIVAPASDVTATAHGQDEVISWTPSADSVEGYNIYRATNPNGPFTRINTSLVTRTVFADANAASDNDTYMVRAVKLEKSASGTYYDPSQGAFTSRGGASVKVAKAPVTAKPVVASKPQAKADIMALGRNLSPTGTTNAVDTIWFDDALPAGASKDSDNDTWTWVGKNPVPESGTLAHQSVIATGMHQHFFTKAANPLTATTGQTLYTYVYIDPANVPSEIMLQWYDGSSWNHRAYWGANNINWFNNSGAAGLVYMGQLPTPGQWVRLEVPASTLNLVGVPVSGMAFTLYGGRATFDNTGKSTPGSTNSGTGSTNSGTGTTNTVTTNTISGDITWVDDSLPAGSTADSLGGDVWNWVSSNPTPQLGSLSHQSSINLGLHQQFFYGATTPLSIGANDALYQYVYIDPANVPTELMLQWNDGTGWEHRAYWGNSLIPWGAASTPGLVYMGSMPPAGQWIRLQVDASKVGLAGASVSGMAYTLYGGRATWDNSGKNVPGSTNSSGSGTNSSTGTGSTNTLGNLTPWFDDALPKGAIADWNVDTWNWVGSNPTPFSGSLAHQSAIASGMHQHMFTGATQTMSVNTGDVLYCYVYLDPANLPSEIMLQWNDGTSYNHRAYWGANNLNYGTDGTAARAYMGSLPAAGQWVQLQIPASSVGLEGSTVSGMAFTMYGGRATWDVTGKGTLTSSPITGGGSSTGTSTNDPSGSGTNSSTGTVTNDPTGSGTNSSTGTVTNDPSGSGTNNSTGTGTNDSGSTGTNSSGTNTLGNLTPWFDDSLPTGAIADWNIDTWNWVTGNPVAFSGLFSHQSAIASGMHQHMFTGATQTMSVNTGDVLYCYVYLDPANLPSEIMLQWNDGTSYNHRAYWGADTLNMGTDGTASRAYMGPLPTAGQWVQLQIPASSVGLEGATVNGMAFTLYGGRATWDVTGKGTMGSSPISGGGNVNTNSPGGSTSTNDPSGTGNTNSASGTNPPPVVVTNTPTGTNDPTSTNTPSLTNALTGASNWLHAATADDVAGVIPQPGSYTLHVLTPTLLELKLIDTAASGSTTPNNWNFVGGGYTFTAPAAGAFAVTDNGKAVTVQSVGFKRRPLFAPLISYDLRIDDNIYLQLASAVSDNDMIQVSNPNGTLWTSGTGFNATVDPLRFNPAIHVNQEGYMPTYSKIAMIGYWAGTMGEVTIPSSSGFKLVDANTGATVFTGTLTSRLDSGWTYSPAPYQKVYQADFSSFTTPGQYRLVVPGMGASLPFNITDGVAMAFARTYALGMYNQRCGTNVSLPWSRYTHGGCHTNAASIPWPPQNYAWTWTTISNYGLTVNPDNPVQTAARINANTLLFPYVNQGTVNVSGGHHDAGDYSKYMTDSASTLHALMFAVDSLPGVAQLDNLGIPESGDGISDVMQEAKWEADYIAKMQDADGGFYFIVYPTTREYESNVTPDKGDPQIVWPKTSTATASAVAALAQCASSPTFKAAYPQVAATYLAEAKKGWTFLTNAIAKYGKNGIYQRITHYGDDFADKDELAWAACEMFLATGDPVIQQTLESWYNPSDSTTWRWGWWHMSESYGNAARSYAFAVKSGRLQASQVDQAYLAKCQAEVIAGGDMMLQFSQQSAYGTSFPYETKAVQGAGWYFSDDQAYDMAVAYQLNQKQDYITALLANMNYEGGCNPVNVCYLGGLGWKRQRDVVSQYALNAGRKSPPSGEPVGNVESGFSALWTYPNNQVEGLVFPQDSGTGQVPFYDRWGDSWNVQDEFVILNQARALGSLAYLAAQTSLKTQPWVSVLGKISSSTIDTNSGTMQFTLSAPGVDLTSAKITWETRDGPDTPTGQTFTFTPVNNDSQWIEAEATLPDGRRVFARNTFTPTVANVVWVNDSAPTGSQPASDGGDPWAWNWVNSNPTPELGQYAWQSAIVSGEHQYFFSGATATMAVPAGGSTLYAYIYIDPANPPSEVMLQWNDGSSWNHRAYWGGNSLAYGTDGSASRYHVGPLPTPGQWVKLAVPSSAVGLNGSTLSGMAFTLYGGRATWDNAGESSQ